MKPIFEIKQEGGIFHLYGDRLGERVTLLAASKFKKQIVDRMHYLEWQWSRT